MVTNPVGMLVWLPTVRPSCYAKGNNKGKGKTVITNIIPAHEVINGTVINDPRFLTRKRVLSADVNLIHRVVRINYTDGTASSHGLADALIVVEGV